LSSVLLAASYNWPIIQIDFGCLVLNQRQDAVAFSLRMPHYIQLCSPCFQQPHVPE